MKRYVYLSITGLILSVFIVIFVIQYITSALKEDVISEIKTENDLLKHEIQLFKNTEKTFLAMLQDHPLVAYNLRNKNDTRQLNDLFYHLTKSKQNIMQLRLLDHSGQEIVRVDRLPNGEIIIIRRDWLQNKQHRYYVKEFLKLPGDRAGFSEFDLNIEHGKVQLPFTPTVRSGIPVIVDGKQAGLIVINYYMESWFRSLGSLTTSDLYIVDKEGYFLYHVDTQWAWSRYRTPPRKCDDYFKFDRTLIINAGQDVPTVLPNGFLAVQLRLFKSQLISVYKPKTDFRAIVRTTIIQLSLIFVLILFLTLGPVSLLLRKLYRNLVHEKNISEQNETYLTTLFNHSFDSIIVINKNAIIEKVNMVACQLFGYTSEELTGKNIKILVPEPHHSHHDDYVRNYHSELRRIIGQERDLHALTKDKKLFPISLAVTQMELNSELYFIGIIRDLTEIKKLEEKEREKESMLLHQSKLASMGEMLGAIAHQWRQPLNSIGLIFQDIVSAYKYDDLSEEYFDTSKKDIMEQLNYMSDTIDDFRKLFVDEKKQKSINAIELVLNIRKLFSAQLKAHNIELEIYSVINGEYSIINDSDQPTDLAAFTVTSFPSDIKQLILNLVSNAKDAINLLPEYDEINRKIQIHLTDEKRSVLIKVIDYAGGIPQEIQKRIFEPYFTTKEMGTGLGLFIAKLMAKRINSTLAFRTEKHEIGNKVYTGTTFYLQIPQNS